ncbi:MAG TPA: helix-turn-helix transcriptional regulator, partial [Firmicutes bacterium]|nr:helix-turn-helix transcriptional regulator [Bacillota bacterium]
SKQGPHSYLVGRENLVFFPLLKKHKEHFSNSEISSVLYISENTVKFHVKNILKKTGCSNRNEIGQ